MPSQRGRTAIVTDESEWDMATWDALTAYVRSTYKISDEQPGMMKLMFETGNLCSQVVLLWRMTLASGDEEWVQIESPIGEIGALDLVAALQEIRNTVCGGLAMLGSDVVTFRHAVPLLNLNINEFESPLHLVTTTADALERKLVGADKY